jgi:hypothetical protein
MYYVLYALLGAIVTLLCSRKWPKEWLTVSDTHKNSWDSVEIPFWPVGFIFWPAVLFVLACQSAHDFLVWHSTSPDSED